MMPYKLEGATIRLDPRKMSEGEVYLLSKPAPKNKKNSDLTLPGYTPSDQGGITKSWPGNDGKAHGMDEFSLITNLPKDLETE